MGNFYFITPAKPFVIREEIFFPVFVASPLIQEKSHPYFSPDRVWLIPILKRKTYYWNHHEEISRSSNFWIGIIPLFCFLYFLKYSFSQRLPIKFNDIFKNAKILKIAPLEPKLWKKFYQLAIGIDFMLYQFLWGIEFKLCQFLWGIDFTTFNSS